MGKKININLARLLKEKNFNIWVQNYLTEYLIDQIDEEYPEGGGTFSMTKGEITEENGNFKNNYKDVDWSNENYIMYAQPLQSDVQDWLRETYNININMKHKPFNQKYGYGITGGYFDGDNGILKPYDFKTFEKYEDALEDALEEGLKLIPKL